MKALSSDIVDMVQIPANMLDRRFEKAGVFDRAADLGKRVYIRSVFLQGLLLMEPGDIPESMNYVKTIIEAVIRMSHDLGMPRSDLALGYVKLKYPAANVVFGAETANQVSANCLTWLKDLPESFLTIADDAFGSIDEAVINPALWPH